MRIECDFVDLLDKNNKLFDFFNDNGQHNDFGFSSLYDYFSQALFPSVSTLMPNMVYCYLIFPLTRVYQLDGDINHALGLLTSYKNGAKSLAEKELGFHGSGIKENIMGTYRNFMKRYGFLEGTEGDSYFCRLNKKLLSTARSSRIIEIFEDESPEKLLESKKKIGNNSISDAVKDCLQQEEKQDLILRMLYYCGYEYMGDRTIDNVGDDKNNSTTFREVEYDKDKLSLLDVICFERLHYSDHVQKIFGFKRMPVFKKCNPERQTKRQFKQLTFEKLTNILNGISLEIINTYRVARFVMIVENLVKNRYNQLVDVKKEEQTLDNSFYEEFLQHIEIKDLEGDSLRKETSRCIQDTNIKEKIMELIKLYELVCNEQFAGADEVIWNLGMNGLNKKEDMELQIKKVERLYQDTFRWEYRPVRELFEDKSFQDKNSETKCASYFIYELFF